MVLRCRISISIAVSSIWQCVEKCLTLRTQRAWSKTARFLASGQPSPDAAMTHMELLNIFSHVGNGISGSPGQGMKGAGIGTEIDILVAKNVVLQS